MVYAVGGNVEFKDIVIQATTPDISVSPGPLQGTFQIQLKSPGMEGTIYYTLDDTDPKGASRETYIEPILVAAGTDIRARVLKKDGNWTRALEIRL